MKKIYLDIMEKALSAYTPERIRDYINEVKRDGLTEHGFPRLGADMGILIAHGRRTELLPVFIEIMDICCEEMPCKKAANDFSVREVCFCLMLLEEKKTVDTALLSKWKSQIASFDPWKYYTAVVSNPDAAFGNWAMFAAVSEYVRSVYCGIDSSDFIDRQLSTQIFNLDSMDMYMDENPQKKEGSRPTNPFVYDMVARFLIAVLLRCGYCGKYAERLKKVLDNTADITLKMLSVTGEIPFGGRSNQFLNNEPLYSAYFELEAARFAQMGDMQKAGEFKASAILAAENTLKYLSLSPISHIKNRYDVSTKIGCEDYGYFNKYMITVASNIYSAYLFGDDSIEPIKPISQKGGYVISTSEDFSKTFLNAGGYFAEIDTKADFHYDANGIGRIHKKDCPSQICLSVPFSPNPNYIIEGKNAGAMSICCYAEKDNRLFLGAESYADYSLIEPRSSETQATAKFDIKLSEDILLTLGITLSEKGVDITLCGAENIGFMIPVFDFDGAESTTVTVTDNSVSVKYKDSVCVYSFGGELSEDYKYYYNRNGRYRVYKLKANALHIEIKKA